ncbi:hypothetical protein JL721_4582 [Aureococcus anophagefferens]|nr:hypothetical protein JL721_4582 [Aureococcus anophagefferens]
MSAEEQAQALQQLRSQVNEQAQRELMTKMTEKCFAKCATGKGSGQLDRNEQMCLANCIDRYADCMNAPARRETRRCVTVIAPPQAVNEALVQRQQSRS